MDRRAREYEGLREQDPMGRQARYKGPQQERVLFDGKYSNSMEQDSEDVLLLEHQHHSELKTL